MVYSQRRVSSRVEVHVEIGLGLLVLGFVTAW